MQTTLHRSRMEREMDLELRFHIEAFAEDLVRCGVPREKAMRRARIEFGGIERIKEEGREARGISFFEHLIQDLRFGVRTMLRSPGFTALAILSLGLGIGANTAIFTLINDLMLKSLPVRDSQQLVSFGKEYGGGVMNGLSGSIDMFSYEFYKRLQTHDEAFQDVTGYGSFTPRVAVHRANTPGSPVTMAVSHLVSGNFFSVLGAQTILGRPLDSSDDNDASSRSVAVISYHYWQQEWSSDPDVVGKAMTVNGTSFTVVGVTAPKFFGVEMDYNPPDMWLPIGLQSRVMLQESLLGPRGFYWMHMMGRSKPGVTRAQAQEWVTTQLRNYMMDREGTDLTPERKAEIQKSYVELLPGANGISTTRADYEQPLQIRALGLLLAYWGTAALIHFVASTAAYTPFEANPDARVLAFSFAISLVTGILFGIGRAMHVSRMGLANGIKANSRNVVGTGTRFGQLLPKILMSAQVALSLVLLVGAGLFLRTLRNLDHQNFGFNRTNLLVVDFDAQIAGYKPEQLDGLYRQIINRIEALPGVRSAALSGAAPLSRGSWNCPISVKGCVEHPNDDLGSTLNRVGPGYFETVGIPLVQGRVIGPEDGPGTAKVVVINETLAHQFFPKGDAIGQTVTFCDGSANSEWGIVGIVKDAKYNDPRETPQRMVYPPIAQLAGDNHYADWVQVRTNGDPAQIAGVVRSTFAQIDGALPVLAIRTISEQLGIFTNREALISRLAGFFSLLALLLACIGLYGVMTYGVVRRTVWRVSDSFGRQGIWQVKARDSNPLVGHAVIDVEAIRCANVVTPVDARGEHDVGHNSAAFLRQLRRKNWFLRTIANELRMLFREHHYAS
ncbi:MAG: ABC transporter permease [Candidatus Acidiferrum sp.]